jgi:hypothetical protein
VVVHLGPRLLKSLLVSASQYRLGNRCLKALTTSVDPIYKIIIYFYIYIYLVEFTSKVQQSETYIYIYIHIKCNIYIYIDIYIDTHTYVQSATNFYITSMLYLLVVSRLRPS